MGDTFMDRQILVMESKAYSNFYTPGWMLMTVDVTSTGEKDKE